MSELRPALSPDGHIWVSWPKPTSGSKAILNEAQVRRSGLAAGLVDTKQCDIDEDWAALKLVIPKADR